MSEEKDTEYEREEAEHALEQLIKRIKDMNEEMVHPEFTYAVSDIIIFGSFVNSNKPTVHDLDIGIELILKKKYQNMSKGELYEIGIERALDNNIRDILLQGIWLKEEVMRYLKNKNNIYSFHPLNVKDSEMIDIVTGEKHLTIMQNGIFL